MSTPKNKQPLTRNSSGIDAERTNSFWREGLIASNSKELSSLPPHASASRQKYLEEENRRLLREKASLMREYDEECRKRKAFEDEIENERTISANLRDRIATLERRVREVGAAVVEGQKREKDYKAALEVLEIQRKNVKDTRERDTRDLQEWSRKDKANCEKIQQLREEIDRAVDDLKRMTANGGVSVLQQAHCNIPSSLLTNNVSSTPPRKSQPMPQSPSAIRKSYEHLQSQHHTLKSAFDSLKAESETNKRHYETWVAVLKERKLKGERRRQKRKEARAKHTNEQYNSAVPYPLGSPSTAAKGKHQDEKEILVEESDPTATSYRPATSRQNVSGHHHLGYTNPTTRLKTPSPVRFSVSSPSTTARPPAPALAPIQSDVAPKPSPQSAIAPSSKPTSLIRDRIGSTFLRKSVASRAMTGDGKLLAGSSAPSTPSQVAGGSTTSDASVRSSSELKRKAFDMEGLSPTEKAKQIKIIGKLPAAEKRELYQKYKKGGRYLVPAELQPGISEKYEIDPERNEGAAFAFHDVKRKKSERKQMHGGDCECCKGYYDAVGAMPKFNQGPRWAEAKDDAETGDEEHEVREHRNKVSRHRDTWVKPLTPPGYWQIGFPTTQEVEEQNRRADTMAEEKEEQIRRDAAQQESKWRKKA